VLVLVAAVEEDGIADIRPVMQLDGDAQTSSLGQRGAGDLALQLRPALLEGGRLVVEPPGNTRHRVEGMQAAKVALA